MFGGYVMGSVNCVDHTLDGYFVSSKE